MRFWHYMPTIKCRDDKTVVRKLPVATTSKTTLLAARENKFVIHFLVKITQLKRKGQSWCIMALLITVAKAITKNA